MKNKILLSITVLLLVFFTSCSIFNNSDNNLKSNKFRWKVKLTKGKYIYNTEDLYFFDSSFDCYMYNKCFDIDSLYETSSKSLKVSKDTTIKFQAYLFTDNYEYMFVTINKKHCWIRAEIPIDEASKIFLKKYLHSSTKPTFVNYVEVIPFKTNEKIFVSCYDSWHIIDIDKKISKQIGSKGGRLEACRMLFPKNCVECYIDLGWGETVYYDEDGEKK